MSKSKNKFQVIIIIAIIITMLLFLGKCVPNTNEAKDTVRCNYCSKVIRSDGKNIHGKPLYNGGVLECDYCGHKTKIN